MASDEDTQSVRPIIVLPEDVVNKIAAGEVVVRPLNAVKELIENSIDAGATEITVTCKNGGLDLIRVKDNGCGIDSADYERVCERFATSKLKTAADLQKISTFGFRGEALASISCMAKVQIVSRPRNAEHAWAATYKNCKPTNKPSVSAGLVGTQITAEKLFQDYPQRRSVFNRPNEEAAGIASVLIKYAINFPHIKFSYVRQDGKNSSSGSFSSLGNGDQHAVIRLLMPSNLTKDLFDFEVSSEKYKFSAKICIASPLSSHTSTAIKARNDKQKIFQLFINNRLVSSTKLKQAVDSAFSVNDSYCPFINIAMQIEPSRIDVNVHPTKELVCFLDETQIVDCIETKLYEVMDNFRNRGIIEVQGVNQSSSAKNTPNAKQQKPVVLYNTTSPTSFEISPITPRSSSSIQKRKYDTSYDSNDSSHNSKSKFRKKTNKGDCEDSPYKFSMVNAYAKIFQSPNSTVRVDASNHSIKEYMFPNTTLHEVSWDSLPPGEISIYNEVFDETLNVSVQSDDQSEDPLNKTVGEMPDDPHKHTFKLLEEIKNDSSIYLTGIAQKFVFVGFVDIRHGIFQSDNFLFLLELLPLLEEMFYQKCLCSAGRQTGRPMLVNTKESPDGIPLTTLVDTYLSLCPNARLPNEDDFETKKDATEALISKMNQPAIIKHLWDYGVWITADREKGPVMKAIAAQINSYQPLLSQQVAQFGYELVCVDWEKPELIGKQIARAVARLHTPHQIASCSEAVVKEQCEMIKDHVVCWMKMPDFYVSEKLRPCFKSLLSTIDAYKIFGRC